MDTRSSDNWEKKPGGWDSLNLTLLQSDDDYPKVYCSKLPVSLLHNVVNINDRKKHYKNSVLCSFIDDYHLERFWNQPERYGLKWVDLNIGAVMTPDFSLYIGMPLPMMQWNTYRSRMLGNLWMEMGLKVIPTVTWAEERSFEFCFQGIRHGSCVAVSDIGIRLPAAANLPVEVELAGGGAERRDTVSGDWRPIVRWRTVVDTEPKQRKKKA